MHETTHLHINFKCPFSTSNLKWIEFLNYTLQLLQLAESHRLRQDIKEMRPWINDIPPVCNANVRESLGIKGKWYRCIRRSIVIDDRPPRLTRICRRPMEFFTCRHIRTYIYTYMYVQAYDYVTVLNQFIVLWNTFKQIVWGYSSTFVSHLIFG